jgi:hypothetical protein
MINDLSFVIIPFDLQATEFRLLISRIRDLIGTQKTSNQGTEVYQLLEGLHRLRIDSLNSEVRNLISEGNYARSAREIVMATLFFSKLY